MEKEATGGKGRAAAVPGIVFFGTPDFAVPSLRKLLDSGVAVRLVISQPDRPSGRGRKVHESPVKKLAIDAGIPLYQPEHLNEGEVFEKIGTSGAECAIVVAFGQILPMSLLDIFPLGTLNVHGSLLPKFRGAAPIQRAIMAGENVTGVAIMLLDAGMDTGPVLSQKELILGPMDTFGMIYGRLAEEGAELLLDTFSDWTAGRLTARAQDDALASYAPPIKREELRINWKSPANNIINNIRAFDPAPGAWFVLGGKRVKCFGASSFSWNAACVAGEVAGVADCGLIVTGGCGRSVCIGELQIEGQRRMRASDFTRGRPIRRGIILE